MKYLFSVITALLTCGIACGMEDTLDGKHIAILGDSSTVSNDAWPKVLMEKYLPSSVRVTSSAIGGSKWSGECGILAQWEKAKKEFEGIPDIIIITTGGNKFPDTAINYDSVLQMCRNLDLKTSGELETAIFSLRKIISDAPASEIYLISNFCAGSETVKDETRLRYRTQLTALCDFFSCRLIDLTRNSCIRGYEEKTPARRIFSTDGVHLYKEAGKERIARLIYGELRRDFPIAGR